MLEGKTRIPPVDVETLPDDLARSARGTAQAPGRAALSVPFYARKPGVFRPRKGMWTALQQHTEARARYAQGGSTVAWPGGTAASSDRIRMLAVGKQARRLDEKLQALNDYAEPALQRRGEGSARIRRRVTETRRDGRRRAVRARATALRRRHHRGADDDHRWENASLALQPGVPHPIARVWKPYRSPTGSPTTATRKEGAGMAVNQARPTRRSGVHCVDPRVGTTTWRWLKRPKRSPRRRSIRVCPGFPTAFGIWSEHIRLAQKDMLDYMTSTSYEEPPFRKATGRGRALERR